MRRRFWFGVSVFGLVVGLASPALACGGLIGPNGAVNLTRTTTLAAHHNGVEHYVTAFKYAGGGGAFGSIVPLPAMPSKVEKGGRWTLQRLQKETAPQETATASFAAAGSADVKGAQEVYKTRIDALDITVLKGGGRSVGIWAADHGFRLPPDAPKVLDFYAKRSPFFMAAVFDSKAAKRRGQQIGDGTPIHVTMPLRDPWVPLRILALGKQPSEVVSADIYLLTDRVPNLLPAAGSFYEIERIVPASLDLLSDLRKDRGMGWLPFGGMTLTHLTLDARAPQVRYDLAISVDGKSPSRVRAGLALPPPPKPAPTPVPTVAPPNPVLTPDPAFVAIDELSEPGRSANTAWLLPLALAVTLVAAALALRARRADRTTPGS